MLLSWRLFRHISFVELYLWTRFSEKVIVLLSDVMVKYECRWLTDLTGKQANGFPLPVDLDLNLKNRLGGATPLVLSYNKQPKTNFIIAA